MKNIFYAGLGLLMLSGCGATVDFGASEQAFAVKGGSQEQQSEYDVVIDPDDPDQPVNQPPAPPRPQPPVADVPDFPPAEPGQLLCGYPVFPPQYLKGMCPGALHHQVKGSGEAVNVELYMFGVYNSENLSHGWPLGTIPLPGERYIAPMQIIVPPGSTPVVLVLSAYEPTDWQITGAVERVRQVYAYGYHCQAVRGVAAEKIKMESYDTGNWGGSAPLLYSGLHASTIQRFEMEFGASLVLGQSTYEGGCRKYTFVASPTGTL